MDLGFLDQSSKVTPILVQLYDSHKLDGLAKDTAPEARATLIESVTDLLEMELSAREAELVADVLIGLMRQAKLDLRQALSEKLSVIDNVPLRLVLQMANDDIQVAECMLKNSPVLDDLDLIYIIKSKTPEYWQAIANRKQMSDQLVNILADTHDFGTALNLIENENISLSSHALAVLSDMAQNSEALAQPLLQRDEVDAGIAKALYQFVGDELKAYIKAEYGISKGEIIDAVDEVIFELQEASEITSEFMPTAAMTKAAMRYKQKGLLTTKLMLGSLRRGQIAAFVSQFAEYTGMTSETVLEVLSQITGQGLAVTCKAYEFSKEDFVSVFLLSNRVRNHGRMVDLKDLTKAINYFTRIDVDVAKGIVKNSLKDELSKDS